MKSKEKSAVTPYFTHEFSKSSVMSFLIFQKCGQQNDIEKKKLLRKNNCRFSEKCCYKSQVFQVLSLRPKGDFYLKKQNE